MTAADTKKSLPFGLMTHAASALAWPAHIQIVPVTGDAMAPTFKEGDYLAVDTTQRAITEGVYVLQKDDGLIARRLNLPIAGNVQVAPDNKYYSPEIIPVDVLAGLIVGRVVFAEIRIY